MTFALYTPDPPLSEYIECLWYQDLSEVPRRELILPSLNIELILNLGRPQKVLDRTDPTQLQLNRAAWVAGMQTEAILIESQDSHMIGARFKPGGAKAFFAFPTCELTDFVVDLDLVWGGYVEELRQQIWDASTPQARLSVFEQALLRKIQTVEYYPLIQRVVGHIVASGGLQPISVLGEHYGISHKHLIHQFKHIIGIRPKQFARSVRLIQTLQLIDPFAVSDWSRIACLGGFYDQSHFINELRRVAGLTPNEYLAKRADFYGDQLQKGTDVIFIPLA
jgi:AraC-like DNA-binding protein